MRDFEKEVIDYIDHHSRNKRKKSDLITELHVSDEEINDFNACLQQMLDQYLIFESHGQYMSRDEAHVIEGRISVNKAGIGFLDYDDNQSIRIEEYDLNTAMHGDTVLVQFDQWEGSGRVIHVLQRARTHLVGTFLNNGRRLQFVPDEERLQSKMLRIHYADDFTPIDGMKVLCDIESYKIPLQLRVREVIGYKDDPGVDISSVLLDHNIETEFPEDVMKQVKRIPQEVSWQDKVGRKDLTKETTVTIDGDDSKDFDDAVSVMRNDNGYLLKVSIADVSHYVTEGSPLDKEASLRGCSTYVTDRVVPMIPHELSNGICSLNPHVERLTITCQMQVKLDGSISDYEIYPSVIRSTERMTYKNVNRILAGDREMNGRYRHLGTLFYDLRDCADAIHYQRMQKGAIEFNSTEAEIKVDEKGHPLSIEPKQRGYAEEMIEDFMIAANVCVANFLKWQEIPAIYRIHERPQQKRIKDFIRSSELMNHKLIVGKGDIHPNEIQRYLNSVKDTPEYPVLSMMMLRCMQKAKYDSRCVGHFGLAEEEYLHFTSPIRRYPDLIVHRMLRKYSFEGCTDLQERVKDEELVQEYAESSSIRERNSADAEFECIDMKKAEYMSDHIGEVYKGIITGVQSYGFYVELPNTVEGLVHIRSLNGYYRFDQERMQLSNMYGSVTYRVGMEVKVKCIGASKGNGNVDFRVITTRTNKVNPKSRSHHDGSRRTRERRGHGRKKR